MANTRMRFDGKVALITGGNAGIGLAAGHAFAGQGAKVMIAARRRAEGEQAVAAINAAGGEADFVETDVTSSASVQAMVAACVARFGRLDVAFNNAGIPGDVTTDIADAEEDTFERVMAVNVRGVWLSMKYEIREILKAGGGAIINCSSFAGLRGGPRSSAYYASKHAVLGMTKALALELAPYNVTANAISPGPFSTEITRLIERDPVQLAEFNSKIPLGRWGKLEEIGALAVFPSSDASGFITGTDIVIDGGWTAQ